MNALPTFFATHPDAILVDVAEAKGSTPREAGAFMVVSDKAIWGTIGGGQLEFLAIDHARRLLNNGAQSSSLDVPLGPEIGQCCGGRTRLSFTRIDARARRLRCSTGSKRSKTPIPTYSSSAPAMWGSRSSPPFAPCPCA